MEEFKPMSMEVSFSNVDPEILNLMFGDAPKEPVFSVEVWNKKRRTFLQWLLRRPRKYSYVAIPYAKFQNAKTYGVDL